MRHATTILAGLGLLAIGTAHAGTARAPDLSSQSCGLATSYDVRIDSGGVWLHREDGSPEDIFIHDGALSVDHQTQAIAVADAQRLRQMEDDARALMPQVAGIARDSIGITFDALATVVRTITGSERKARKVERRRERALADIDGSLGEGRWNQRLFHETFEADITQAAEETAHGIARSALWAVFTGRAHRLDERADRVDAEVDKLVEARSAALQQRAQALCSGVADLRRLQEALEFRYHGAPLVMLEPALQSAPAAATATATASVNYAGHDDP